VSAGCFGPPTLTFARGWITKDGTAVLGIGFFTLSFMGVFTFLK
jgi:hypothetical protein